jgi:hypothetical protein
MGWSCAVGAARTAEAMAAFAEAQGWPVSNSISARAFWESDRVEHHDGAITGEVVDMKTSQVRAARIEPNGRISAMPGFDVSAFSAWAMKGLRWNQVGLAQRQETAEQFAAPVRAAPDGERESAVFEVDGARYTLAELLEANADDSALCEWLRTAPDGDRFPALISCTKIARDGRMVRFGQIGAPEGEVDPDAFEAHRQAGLPAQSQDVGDDSPSP